MLILERFDAKRVFNLESFIEFVCVQLILHYALSGQSLWLLLKLHFVGILKVSE